MTVARSVYLTECWSLRHVSRYFVLIIDVSYDVALHYIDHNLAARFGMTSY